MNNYQTCQQALRMTFKFSRKCETRSLPLSQRRDSDQRRARMAVLDTAITQGTIIRRIPIEALQKADELLSLGEAEGFHCAFAAQVHDMAFQIAIAHSDEARAKVFLERAVAGREISEGPDSPEVIRLKALTNNPASRPTRGRTKMLRTLKTEIPENLVANAFEDWLWHRKA